MGYESRLLHTKQRSNKDEKNIELKSKQRYISRISLWMTHSSRKHTWYTHGHQFKPSKLLKFTPKKTEKPSSCTKLSPQPPQKKQPFLHTNKPHTYLTQTYPNLIYLLMYKHLGGWILVSRVWNFHPQKARQNWQKNSFPPPSLHIATSMPLRPR